MDDNESYITLRQSTSSPAYWFVDRMDYSKHEDRFVPTSLHPSTPKQEAEDKAKELAKEVGLDYRP